MRWLKRNLRKIGIVVTGGFLLAWAVWLSFSVLEIQIARAPAINTRTVQAMPTVNVTVVVQDQLKQQDEKARRDNSFPWTILNAIGGSILLAAAAIVSTIIGFSQWRGNQNAERKKEIAAQDKESKDRKEAQDKDLRAQAEERFKTAVTALGNENEATQVGGAVLLRSFLNKDDEEIYGRYYSQTFDLAVAYLRLSSTSQPSKVLNTPLPLTPLRQALIVVFKESFPLARDWIKKQSPQGSSFDPRAFDAMAIRLDNAYLVEADLVQSRLGQAFLRRANLSHARLNGANLRNAHFEQAMLHAASLRDANLKGAYLTGANLEGVDLTGASLTGARLSGVNLEDALSLADTNLCRVTGLTKEQLEACKAEGAIIDEDTTVSPAQSTVSPPPPSQGNDAQTPSASPAQVSTPPPSTDAQR